MVGYGLYKHRTCYAVITLPDGREAELEINGEDEEYFVSNVVYDGSVIEEDESVIEKLEEEYADEISHEYYCGN